MLGCTQILAPEGFSHTEEMKGKKSRKIMKNIIILLLVMASWFLVGCDQAPPPHIPMIKLGNNAYLYVAVDEKVAGVSGLHFGYSLRSSKDDRILQTFIAAPKEVRLEDFDGDGVKDIVYIVIDKTVSGSTPLNYGYSMRVALGKKDGTFQLAKVIKTFKSIN